MVYLREMRFKNKALCIGCRDAGSAVPLRLQFSELLRMVVTSNHKCVSRGSGAMLQPTPSAEYATVTGQGADADHCFRAQAQCHASTRMAPAWRCLICISSLPCPGCLNRQPGIFGL